MSEDTEGGDALIHLRVPASRKARWVRESRAAGMRLTDWIIKRVEREDKNMNVYKIPDTLASQYHGAGWALAAIAGGRVVALRYLADVASPDIVDAMGKLGPHARMVVRQWISMPQAGPVVRELQALGEVSAGMLSAGEFCEL